MGAGQGYSASLTSELVVSIVCGDVTVVSYLFVLAGSSRICVGEWFTIHGDLGKDSNECE